MLFIEEASLKRQQEIFTKIMELFQIIKKNYHILDFKELIDHLNQL